MEQSTEASRDNPASDAQRDLTGHIIAAFYVVKRELGPGLPEYVYANAAQSGHGGELRRTPRDRSGRGGLAEFTWRGDALRAGPVIQPYQKPARTLA